MGCRAKTALRKRRSEIFEITEIKRGRRRPYQSERTRGGFVKCMDKYGIMDKYDALIKQYRELFNNSPPLIGLPYEEAIEKMETAIKKRKSLPSKDKAG